MKDKYRKITHVWVHANQIQEWRRQLVDKAMQLFEKGGPAKDTEGTVKELHAKIGQLTMDRDFLSEKLGRSGARHAER